FCLIHTFSHSYSYTLSLHDALPILMAVSHTKGLRVFASVYVDIIRGIPMMVLAFFIFFGLPQLIGFTIPDFTAGVITLTLNASADRKSTRLNSSHVSISYAVFCLKK